jgi:hypothetical protein
MKWTKYFIGQAIHFRWKEKPKGHQYSFIQFLARCCGHLIAIVKYSGESYWAFFVSSGNKEYKNPINPVDPV